MGVCLGLRAKSEQTNLKGNSLQIEMQPRENWGEKEDHFIPKYGQFGHSNALAWEPKLSKLESL